MGKEEILGRLICGLMSVVVVVVVVVVTRRRGANGRFPPGPVAWPVVGHLYLFILSLPHQSLASISKKYGPVLGLRLGQQRAVVVCSPQAAKEVLLTHDKFFADRPPFEITSILNYGIDSGIIMSRNGPHWRRHRKICTLHLFTSKRMQELQSLRQQEMHGLLLSIHKCSRAATVNLGECVGEMSSRLLTRLVMSNPSMQVGDENLHHLFKEVEQAASFTMRDFMIPSLSYLDFFKKQRMRQVHDRVDTMFTKVLMERKKGASFHDDLLHSLLSQEDTLTVDEIKNIVMDIIGAGIHTTALTLEWAMAELLRNPHCFHRLQREIDTKLGERIQVTDVDLPNLSYLNCVVKEVFRLHPVTPLLVPHFSIKDCEVQGYIIPAKTIVFVNTWAIGRDERVWPNANDFTPERFEGSDLDFKGQHFELLPFGSGRRTCLGLPFASLVVQVTLANLVKCFDWELPNGKLYTSIDMHEKAGMTADKATPLIVIPKSRVPLPIE